MSRPELRLSALPDGYRQIVADKAADMDVDNGVYLAALVVGAMDSGNADRHAMAGLEKVPHKTRQKARTIKWEPEGSSPTGTRAGGAIGAASWHYKDWTLVRLGNPAAWRSAGPEDGWYLEGPGLDEPKHMKELAREKACDEASTFISLYEQRTAAS